MSTFDSLDTWFCPCPKCGEKNSPLEGHVNTDDVLVLRYECSKCNQKYERKEQLNEITIRPLIDFSMPKTYGDTQ